MVAHPSGDRERRGERRSIFPGGSDSHGTGPLWFGVLPFAISRGCRLVVPRSLENAQTPEETNSGNAGSVGNMKKRAASSDHRKTRPLACLAVIISIFSGCHSSEKFPVAGSPEYKKVVSEFYIGLSA